MSHVFLIGFMGAGKSTVGRLLAARLGRPFVDLDSRIERMAGATIREIFAAQGEPRFRELETEALSALDGEPASVVACGGGVIVAAHNRETLSRLGTVVYLRVSISETIARIGDDPSRPLLRTGAVSAEQLLAARESLYTATADLTVDTVGHGPEQVADRIMDMLNSEVA